MSQVVDKLKEYPVAVVAAVVLLLCVGVGFMRGSVVDELTTQENELVARLLTINENIKNSKNLEQDVEALELDVASIEGRLFRRRERSINTAFFYSLEDQIDIVISDVNQLAEEDTALIKGGPHELKLYSGISYEISVSGSFQEILGFIYELYKTNSLIRVAGLQLDVAKGQGGESGALYARFRVIVLAEKE